MALVPLTQPEDIAAVRDEVWLELSCTGYRTTAPTTASYTIFITTQPSAGYSFTLALPTGDLVFTFVAGTPDDTGLQVEIGAAVSNTRTNLYNALRANWFVDQLFLITTASGTHTLTARTAGEVIVGFTNTTPVTLSWTTVSPGTSAVYATNYNAMAQVWVEEVYGSNSYTALPAVMLSPDKVDRRVKLDLHTLLKNKTGYDWPAFGTSALTVLDKAIRRYYYTYWEQLGDPPVAEKMARSPLKNAWYAGSRHIERNVMENIWSLIRRSDVLNPFLTYRGRAGAHEVSPVQDHYIAWYRRVAKVTDTHIKLLATVYYDDATNDTDEIWVDTNGSGYNQWRVGQFPVGFERMGLDDLQPAKTPTHYTVQVLSAADAALSEIHTFILVDTDVNEIHVEFVNSLGVVESLRCKGSWVHGMTPAHSTVTRLRTPDNGSTPSEQESNAIALLDGAQERLQVSTGYMDRGELNALMDVLVSPEWRWVDTVRSTRHPLRLVGAEEVMRVQGEATEHLYAMNLEFLVCDPEMAWSDRFSWPAMPEDPEEAREPEYAP
jgi:hypothetical protein